MFVMNNRHLTLEQLQEYPEYKNLTVLPSRPVVATERKSALPLDPIIKLIYAPDPVTGIPRSDIGLEYSADVSDELHSYIRSRLQQPHDFGSAGEDADIALASVRDRVKTPYGWRKEFDTEYIDRLRDIVTPKTPVS